MIPPIETLFPTLERDVKDRVESKALHGMDPEDLRSVIYSLVARQSEVDPSRHFAELVTTAQGSHQDLLLARDQSVAVRSRILEEILRLLPPAIPSLLSSIVVGENYVVGQHPRRKHHSTLSGYQLIEGQRTAPAGANKVVYSGTSWWIVGVIPEDPLLGTGVRYARAKHSGTLVKGEGQIASDVVLVTSLDAAEQIKDSQFRGILERLYDRLKSMSGTKIASATDSLWRVGDKLKAALDAME